MRVVERFDSEPVARKDGPTPRLVPDGQRELPAQVPRDVAPMALVEVRDDLDPSSFANGWWPPSTSTMLSLRTPSAIPSARYVPRSSGPRWVMMSVIQSRTSGETTGRGDPCTWMTPQIPHIVSEG